MSSCFESVRLDFTNSRVDRVRLLTNVLEVIVEGCIKCCQVLSSCYKSTQLDFMNSRVDRVRLCIKVIEVVVVGRMESCTLQEVDGC